SDSKGGYGGGVAFVTNHSSSLSASVSDWHPNVVEPVMNMNSNGISQQLTEAENEHTKHAYSVAYAATVAAEAAVAAAHAAAEVVRLTSTTRLLNKSTEEIAVVKIQATYHGHLARRTVRAVRGIGRLKALIQGQSVKRQAVSTLKCMQTLARVQSQVDKNAKDNDLKKTYQKLALKWHLDNNPRFLKPMIYDVQAVSSVKRTRKHELGVFVKLKDGEFGKRLPNTHQLAKKIGPQRILVYEYMKNKSLDLILYGKNDMYLNRSIRFQIIIGIARGLHYLHKDSDIRIVHRDIKASNIPNPDSRAIVRLNQSLYFMALDWEWEQSVVKFIMRKLGLRESSCSQQKGASSLFWCQKHTKIQFVKIRAALLWLDA
ncbi:LOW QUALITY PROTEIN: hypothetical protein M8C21_024045, partial [Ambrosia artemisiifolia]